MKTINKFLIEKLKVYKDMDVAHHNTLHKDLKKTVNIKIPRYDHDNDKIDKNINMELEIPVAKYILYADAYRGSVPHLNIMGEFLLNIALFFDDFEGWNPKSQILFYSNDIHEIIFYYFSKVQGISIPTVEELKTMDEEDIENAIEDAIDKWSHKKGYDNAKFLLDIYTGKETEFIYGDNINDDEIDMSDYTNYNKFSDHIESMIG